MAEVNITYETLFELLRREKTRRELQKMENSFYTDVALYIQEKKKILEEKKFVNDLFAAEEKRKAEVQFENTMKILKELYERRERKIVDMALDKSKTVNGIMDTSVLMPEEKDMYHLCVKNFEVFRKGILYNLLEAKMPALAKDAVNSADTKTKNVETPKPEAKEEKKSEQKQEIKTAADFKDIKFTNAVPKFIGTDLKEYGPFEPGDSAPIPSIVADVLISKGRAVILEQKPEAMDGCIAK